MKNRLLCSALVLICTSAQAQVELVDTAFLEIPAMRDYCIGATGEEDYFTIQSINGEISQIATRHKSNGVWSEPVLMPFCDAYTYMEPSLSPDGMYLYFASDRPVSDTSHTKKDFDIWYVKRPRPGAPWSKPIALPAPVNSAGDEFYPCLTANQDLYFTMDAKSGLGKDDIYVAHWNGKSYDAPLLCSTAINSAGYEFNAWVAPDGNTMIYTKYATADGFGSGDLYMAQKDQAGNWQPAVNMGIQCNSAFMEYCPYYDYNTQTLYFTSKRSSLEPKDYQDIDGLLNEISGAHNGQSRLYRMPLQLPK